MLLATLAVLLATSALAAQVVRPLRPFQTKGTVKSVDRGTLVMTDSSGRPWQLRFSTGDRSFVTLSNNVKFPVRRPLVEVSGDLGKQDMQEGMAVQFQCYADSRGRIREPLAALRWMDENGLKPAVRINKKRSNDQGEMLCQVTGTIERLDENGFVVRVPRSRTAENGTMSVPMSDDIDVQVKTRDISRAREGDVISQASGVELSSGDFVVQKIAIRLVKQVTQPKGTRKRRAKRIDPTSLVVDAKYAQLDDTPVAPRSVRSRWLVVTTDLSDRKAKMLLDELQQALVLLTQYYRRPIKKPLTCYVVADNSRWTADQLPAAATEALAAGATHFVRPSTAGSGRAAATTFYAKYDLPLLRAALFRCYGYQQFGDLGPEWYEQGMAEVVKFWQDPPNEVAADAATLRVLSRAKETKPLKEILQPTDVEASREERRTSAVSGIQTADAKDKESLAAYRWALCYMLSHNPNYQRTFVELGTNLMRGREASLTSSYGKVSKQLLFEFQQFTRDVETGYRLDLCAWQWKHPFKELDRSGNQKATIQAQQGWQPLVLVTEGTSYDLVAKGEWKIDGTGRETTADGDEKGIGKLVGMILRADYSVAEPMEFGTSTSFRAPATGRLYVRCREAWGKLADNSGRTVVYIRQSRP